MQNIPRTIDTSCPQLNAFWEQYATELLAKPGLLIADTDDDLNLHAFLGHSVDMQGFRAGEFVGVDPISWPSDFVSLKAREIAVKDLAHLWHVKKIREHLQVVTSWGHGSTTDSTYDTLVNHGGLLGESLAHAFRTFPRRKQNRIIRRSYKTLTS